MDLWKEMSSSKQVSVRLHVFAGSFLPLLNLSTRPRLQFILSLHFTPSCVLISVCSLHFTPGLQSAVRSPQSSFYTDRFALVRWIFWIKFQIILSWRVPVWTTTSFSVFSSFSFRFLHEKTPNLVEIEKKIGAAGSYCMDQSYFRILLLRVRKSKQPGFVSLKKVWLKGMQPLITAVYEHMWGCTLAWQLNETILCSVVGRIKVLTEHIFLA